MKKHFGITRRVMTILLTLTFITAAFGMAQTQTHDAVAPDKASAATSLSTTLDSTQAMDIAADYLKADYTVTTDLTAGTIFAKRNMKDACDPFKRTVKVTVTSKKDGGTTVLLAAYTSPPGKTTQIDKSQTATLAADLQMALTRATFVNKKTRTATALKE